VFVLNQVRADTCDCSFDTHPPVRFPATVPKPCLEDLNASWTFGMFSLRSKLRASARSLHRSCVWGHHRITAAVQQSCIRDVRRSCTVQQRCFLCSLGKQKYAFLSHLVDFCRYGGCICFTWNTQGEFNEHD
jgi:hypothetical protein